MGNWRLLLPLLLSACFPVVLPVANPSDAAPNIYGAWRVNDIGGYAPADTETVLTINSSDDGFRLTAACHRVGGHYVLKQDGALSFGGLRFEGRCEGDEAEQYAGRYLNSVAAYRFNGRHLELLNAGGKVVLSGRRLRDERPAGQSDSGDTAYLNDARRH